MKWLLALFLSLLSVVAYSATPNIHRPHRRVSAPRKTQIVVPWKTVAAGGRNDETHPSDMAAKLGDTAGSLETQRTLNGSNFLTNP